MDCALCGADAEAVFCYRFHPSGPQHEEPLCESCAALTDLVESVEFERAYDLPDEEDESA